MHFFSIKQGLFYTMDSLLFSVCIGMNGVTNPTFYSRGPTQWSMTAPHWLVFQLPDKVWHFLRKFSVAHFAVLSALHWKKGSVSALSSTLRWGSGLYDRSRMAWFLHIGLGLKWTYSGLIKKKDALAFRASLVNLRYWYYIALVHPIWYRGS